MSVQRYISSSFWSDDWIGTLSCKEKRQGVALSNILRRGDYAYRIHEVY